MAKKTTKVQPATEGNKQVPEIIPATPEADTDQDHESTTPQQLDLVEENEILKSENCELRIMLAEQKLPEYLVVIPYKASEAQGCEIHLAIHGWLRHFKEHFRLVIVGDAPGDIDYTLPDNVSGIIHIPHECTTDNPPLDITAKLQEVITAFPEYSGLILTNDDIYPVNAFDITEVKLLKSDGLLTDQKSIGGKYAENRTKTLKLLQAEHLPVYDYGCHTPVYLDAAKLLELIEKFNLTESACLITSLYFNYFFPERIPLKLDLQYDNLKAGVYRQNANLTMLREISRRKIWISNSVSGWSDQFAVIINEILS